GAWPVPAGCEPDDRSMGDAGLDVNPDRSAAARLHSGFVKSRMSRADGGRPGRGKIGQFRLQTLHFEPKRPSARKNKGNRAGGGVPLGKLDGQQIKDIVLMRGIYVLALAGQNALETQGCPTPSEFMIAAVVCAFPVETIEPDNEPFFPRPPMNI